MKPFQNCWCPFHEPWVSEIANELIMCHCSFQYHPFVWTILIHSHILSIASVSPKLWDSKWPVVHGKHGKLHHGIFEIWYNTIQYLSISHVQTNPIPYNIYQYLMFRQIQYHQYLIGHPPSPNQDVGWISASLFLRLIISTSPPCRCVSCLGFINTPNSGKKRWSRPFSVSSCLAVHGRSGSWRFSLGELRFTYLIDI